MSSLETSTVRILDEEGPRGTGFVFLSRDVVVTCAHVVDYPAGHKTEFRPLPSVRVQSLAGSETTATIDPHRWSDQNSQDVALLSLAQRLDDVTVLGIARGIGLAKQELHVVGTPKAGGLKWLEDWPTLFGHTRINDQPRLQLSTKIETPHPEKSYRGFSGGPVFAASKPAIVGMIVESPNRVRIPGGGYGGISNLMLAIPMETICEVAQCPELVDYDDSHYLRGVMESLIAIRRARRRIPLADAILVSGDLGIKADLNIQDEAEWAESLAREMKNADDRDVVRFLDDLRLSDRKLVAKASLRVVLRDLVRHLVPWKYCSAPRIVLPTVDAPFILVPSVSDFIVEASHAAMHHDVADWQPGTLRGRKVVSPLVLGADKKIRVADPTELQHSLARAIEVGEKFLKRRDARNLIKLALRKHRQRHRPPYVPLDPQEIDDRIQLQVREQLIQFKEDFPEVDLLEKAEPDDLAFELELYSKFIEEPHEEK